MPYAAFHAGCEVLTNPDVSDLAAFAATSDARGLVVFSWRFPDLRPLRAVAGRLHVLKISGAPQLATLDGVELVPELQELVLATPTGSAGSGRLIRVASFAPLEKLTALRRLILQGVRPDDLDLAPIRRMLQLREVDVDGGPEFSLEDYARLAAALPHATGRCLRPHVTIAGIGICRTCKRQMVLLVGAPPRARKFLCPTCNPKPLAAHVARWEQIAGRPLASG